MKYNVEEPNGNVHEITVPKNAVGQVCFEKLCEKLGIVEQHYFGLTRSVNHDTKAWLNLRNPLMTQLRPHITGKPHRLRLDVKFYVLPQEIQHERTRHFFYHALKRNLGEGKFVLSQNQLTKLYALMRQTESGDFVHSSVGEEAAAATTTTTPLNALEVDIQQEHLKLKAMPESVAKLKFISILAETELYFWDLFKVKLGGEKLIAAVGTMGLRLIYRRSPQCTREIVSYYDISKISLFEERMILVVKRANDTYRFLHFFHTSCESAKVMHKCVLEKKLFYFEPKILDSVRNHYMLSFPRWAYPSKWLTRKTVPELYHLDVRCTRRQAYEEHFEALHKTDNSKVQVVDNCAEDDCDGFDEAMCPIPVCKKCNDSENIIAYSPCGHVEHCIRCANGVQVCGVCDAPIANMLKTYIATDGFSDELVCQICMDKELSTVFSPCGHIYCCDECAAKLTFCPLCKKWILFNQRIQFLCLDVPKGCCT